ncbi:MAG: hypothetical protein ABFD58_14075 [Anaerolineaceae bacterium]
MLNVVTCTTRNAGEHLAVVFISSVIAISAICEDRSNPLLEITSLE